MTSVGEKVVVLAALLIVGFLAYASVSLSWLKSSPLEYLSVMVDGQERTLSRDLVKFDPDQQDWVIVREQSGKVLRIPMSQEDGTNLCFGETPDASRFKSPYSVVSCRGRGFVTEYLEKGKLLVDFYPLWRQDTQSKTRVEFEVWLDRHGDLWFNFLDCSRTREQTND